MFCGYCGKQNADGAAYCIFCGNPTGYSNSMPDTSQKVPLEQTIYSQKRGPTGTGYIARQAAAEKRGRENQIMFRKSWRELFGSPIFLTTAVAFTVSCIIEVFSWLESFENIKHYVNLFGMLSAVEGLIYLQQLASVLPSILIVIGFWQLYADSKNSDNQPVKTIGMSTVYGSQLFVFITICITIFAVLMILCTAASEAAKYSGYRAGSATAEASRVGIALLIIITVVVVFYVNLLNVLRSAKKASECSIPDTSGVTAVAVCLIFVAAFYSIIVFIGSASSPILEIASLNIFASGTSIGTVIQSTLSCVKPVLASILLLKYQNMIRTVNCYRMRE